MLVVHFICYVSASSLRQTSYSFSTTTSIMPKFHCLESYFCLTSEKGDLITFSRQHSKKQTNMQYRVLEVATALFLRDRNIDTHVHYNTSWSP